MKTKTQKQEEWHLRAIYCLANREGRDYFGSKEINDELRKMPELLREDSDATIRSAGFRRNDLKNKNLLIRNHEQSKSTWALTTTGKKFAFDLEQDDLQPLPKPITIEQAIATLAEKAGIAREAIEMLRNCDIPSADLDKLLQRWIEEQSQPIIPLSSKERKTNLEVEKKAIDFIRKKEPEWRRTRRNNPGFDLYQTDNNTGKMNLWCEVKSLSGAFHSALLTPI